MNDERDRYAYPISLLALLFNGGNSEEILSPKRSSKYQRTRFLCSSFAIFASARLKSIMLATCLLLLSRVFVLPCRPLFRSQEAVTRTTRTSYCMLMARWMAVSFCTTLPGKTIFFSKLLSFLPSFYDLTELFGIHIENCLFKIALIDF